MTEEPNKVLSSKLFALQSHSLLQCIKIHLDKNSNFGKLSNLENSNKRSW